MFDLASAVVLGLVVMGLVTMAMAVKDGKWAEVVICLAVSFGAVMLVAASDFAHEQVVLDRPLDTLNLASQAVVALLIAGVAATAWETLKAAKNIGQNQ